MATGNTNFGNSAGTGTVGADQFNGPVVGNVTGNLTGNVTGSISGGTVLTTATVAAAGATQGGATAIAAASFLVNVTATASSEGVKLPTAATGKNLTLLAPTTKGVKVYGGAAGQIINAATTATTAYVMTTNEAVTFFGISATAWRAVPTTLNVPGATTLQSTLAVTGLATLSGGQNVTGQKKSNVVTVKVTGNAVGNARTVGTTASIIVTTATASTEGVKLPTPSTGLQIQIQAPTAVAVLVYASAAGQSIGTGTTNTTAFKVTANTGTLFTAISTTKWLVSVA